MNSEILVTNILLHAYTEAHAQRCIFIFRKAMESILFKQKQVPEAIADSFLDYIKKETSETEKKYFIGWSVVFLNQVTRENFPSVLEETEKKISDLHKVSVWFAYQPDYETERRVHNFLSSTIKSNFLLSIHVDESCIGGCIIEQDGVVFDYSIKNYIRTNTKKLDNIIATYESNR